MITKNWYLDKRVFVPGKQNPYMNLANFEWFNDIVSQIIYGTTPGIPAGPLLFRNGITPTPTTANYIVEWGGLLTQDTVISGNSLFDVLFKDIPEITFLGDNTTLSGSLGLSLRTPNYLIRPVGSILQKIGVGGQTEYTPYELPLVDGALGEALITDGLGTLTWQSVAPTGADNGLTLVGTDVHLGGTLISNTTILGDNFPFNIFNMSSFQWESVGIGLLEADDLLLRGNSSVSVQTPNVIGSTAVVGQLLQLVVNTGEIEYTPYKVPVGDGLSEQMLKTDGSGNVTWEHEERTVTIEVFRFDEQITSTRHSVFPISPDLDGWEIVSLTLSTYTSAGTTSIPFVGRDNIGVSWISGNHAIGTSTYIPGGTHTINMNEKNSFQIDSATGDPVFGLYITLRLRSQ